MKNILKKLAVAKKMISWTKITKEWKNSFSNYNYFTPEQVNWIVEKVCEELRLLTKFDLMRDEYGVEWQLTVYDIDTEESLTFISATAIPEIKATNVAQQMWWCMTYTERYLKMTAFGIADNSLDFDTTENTKKVAEEKKDITKEWPFMPNDLPRFNKEELEQLKWNEEWVKEHETSDDLIKAISTKYRVSKAMKQEIADFWASL